MVLPAGRATRTRVVAVFGFGSGGEPFEGSRPRQVEVGAQQGEAIGIEAIDPLGARRRAGDQAGVAQDPQVKGYGRSGDRELSGELGDGPGPGREEVHDGAPGAVAEGVEHVVSATGRRSVLSIGLSVSSH
jgi:hypothetical protein